MESKLFEIRDKATFIPILAIRLTPASGDEGYLLSRAGYGFSAEEQGDYILLVQIAGGSGKVTCDPYYWCDRTYKTTHEYIQANFDLLKSGDVVDVEFILRDTEEPKKSERLCHS